MAIRFGAGAWAGLRSEPLIRSDIVVVAARALIGDRQITDPAMLVEYPWLQELGTNEVSTWLARQGVIPTRKLSITHLPGYMTVEAVRSGQGISATARVWVEDDIEAGRMLVLFQDHQPDFGYHIVTRPGIMRAPLKAFVSWLRRQRAAAERGRPE